VLHLIIDSAHQTNIISIDIPESVAYKAAHSNYFQVLGDSGYLGLLIFLALMASAFLTSWRNNRLARRLPKDHAWAADLSTALSLSLIAFMSGGAGVSLAYFELAYLQVVMLSVLHRYLTEQADIEPRGIDPL
jgi:O-antigen ligase